MTIARKIGIGIVAILIILQFFGIDKENPVSDPAMDFITITQPEEEVKQILKNACYDCHSNLTQYPWYTNITPLSWWIKDHINEGRKELNFSEWGSFSDRKKDHKLEEVVELVGEGEMPLKSYTLAHSEANLTKEQIALLIAFSKQTRTDIGYVKE